MTSHEENPPESLPSGERPESLVEAHTGEAAAAEGFRAGFVAIAGKPNVGKSTLMNALLGAKVSAVSRRPQTTRNEIKGILSESGYQIVFLDTPGLIHAQDRLNEFLTEQAVAAVRDVDLLYHMVEVHDPRPLADEIAPVIERLGRPKFLVVNKIDQIGAAALAAAPYRAIAARYDEVHPVSAATGAGLRTLLARTIARLPVHDPYYDEEILTDRDERFLVAEIVREKLFELTGQELPYSIATQVDEFIERPDRKDFVRVYIFVERESQKGMVVGQGGQILKQAGELARADIEELLGRPIYLELWVKVRKNWRKDETELRRLGYLSQARKQQHRPRRRRS